MSKLFRQDKARIVGDVLLVYDVLACSREEDDPAQSILYFRPNMTPTTTRIALAGQLAGVVHFCRSAFAPLTAVRTSHFVFSVRDCGRFFLVLGGSSTTWVEDRLNSLLRILEAATGGLDSLWESCLKDTGFFMKGLSSLLDSLIPIALPDASFKDELPLQIDVLQSPHSADSRTPSTSSSSWEVSEGFREGKLAQLHRVFDAVPSVPLPKSGGSVFLRAQSILEACQQQGSILGGVTTFRKRVLGSQLAPRLSQVLLSLPFQVEDSFLERHSVEYQLPNGVTLHLLHVPTATLKPLQDNVYKSACRRQDRGLRSEADCVDLTRLRMALDNQRSQPPNSTYPSSLSVDMSPRLPCSAHPQRKLMHLQKAYPNNKHLNLSDSSRPALSLPGTPRKIKVDAMLPEVGSNSPDLRYKVLTGRRPKPSASSNNTPKRFPGGRVAVPRNTEAQIYGLVSQNSGCAPVSPVSPYEDAKDINYPHKNNGSVSLLVKNDSAMKNAKLTNGIRPEEMKEFNKEDNEINIKNTKNRLNLHFAPGKINRPSNEEDIMLSKQEKALLEINGNINKMYGKRNPEVLDNNRKSVDVNTTDCDDDEDTSRSEDSEISVLDISAFIDSKDDTAKNIMEIEDIRVDDSHTPVVLRTNKSATSKITKEGLNKEEMDGSWQTVTLYSQVQSETALYLLIRPEDVTPHLIYELWKIGDTSLPGVEAHILRAAELSEKIKGDPFLHFSSSIISSSECDTLEEGIISDAHSTFKDYARMMEITMRNENAVVWGHRIGNSETYYQIKSSVRPGLPIPSDAIAKIPHIARRRLERDYAITLL